MPKPLTVWITTNWKILKEMGLSDPLTCLLRNLYAGQEVTVRTGHGTTDWFQIGKGVRQGCILSPCLFNLYAEYNIEMLGWMKHKLESRLLRGILWGCRDWQAARTWVSISREIVGFPAPIR